VDYPSGCKGNLLLHSYGDYTIMEAIGSLSLGYFKTNVRF
jgi:hypothetical protein